MFVAGDILSDPYDDLWSDGSIQRGGSIHYPRIQIQAYNNAMRDVCNWGFLFSAGLVWIIEGVVKHHTLWQQGGMSKALRSTEVYHYQQYAKLFTNVWYITSCIYSILLPSSTSKHVNKRIFPRFCEYGSTGWPSCFATMVWQHFRIIR